ncbi:D-3-phosphoglycerate dehydrogenase [Parelusimicrobium proximum]|uniref:NAD(P)-dependent oxidoreductase n=1 Tax=Parelusimicrobium proximum TaxID=3228953 RepID=UPI003D1641E5
MKILIADKFPKHWTEVLKNSGYEIVSDPALDENTLSDAQAKEGAEVIIVRSTKVNAKTIDASANLKLIIRAGAGYDTIDTAHAKEKGVAVCNCPGTNSIAVAELAMALILGLDRHIADNVEDCRAGKWNKAVYSKAKGLYGRTIGIIGLGNIGREVAKRAAAFGMKIVGFDPYLNKDLIKGFEVTMTDDILDLAAKSDVITIHTPAGEKNFYSTAFFSAMKDGAYFVNTSRGSLVDEEALLKAVKEKNILAALDVYQNEPKADAKEFNDPIAKERNIYGTHHIGASTEQAQDAVAELAVKIIETFKKDGTFLHQVNK